MQKKVNRNIKWIFDKTVSLTGLIALSPVFATLSVVIKFESPGLPIFFRQTRIGQYGKPFSLVKFRNMRPGENDKSQHITVAGDPRITRIGRFLRKYKLDELPQLWNVFKGDMSLIGPRPLLVQYLPLYSPEQARRHEVRPGITGWAQCHGRNSISWKKKFELDVWYVDNISFITDIKVILTTIKKVIKRDGISQEGQATLQAFDGNN